MLATMNSELQKQHGNMDAFDMIEHLKPKGGIAKEGNFSHC
ncbi:hypothetical protein A2U01_0108490, partial [Trifolium medium]|nr:hypothetical protein [Trifolium medium]